MLLRALSHGGATEEMWEWCSTEDIQYFSVKESLETAVLLRNCCAVEKLLCYLKTAVLLRN